MVPLLAILLAFVIRCQTWYHMVHASRFSNVLRTLGGADESLIGAHSQRDVSTGSRNCWAFSKSGDTLATDESRLASAVLQIEMDLGSVSWGISTRLLDCQPRYVLGALKGDWLSEFQTW